MPSHPAPPILRNAFRGVRNVLFAALLFGGADLLAQQPNITASQTDAFPSHPDGRAREGDTITYTTTISNATGTADATGVQLANPTPLNTTDVAGSIQVSPLGFPDSYPAGENMALTVVAPGVLGNDTGIPAPSAVPIAAGPTTQGGTITLNANGSFTYNPATNFTGTDTFTYTVTNIQPPNDTAIVTLTVIPPPVANPDGYNTVKNIALSVVAPGVLGNDTTNGAPIVSYGITGNEQTIIGSPTATAQAGSVSLNADGSLSYTPPVDFTGSDTFNYTLSNIGGASIATVTFSVTCQAIAVTNPTNAAGTANTAFSETFTQTGGTGTTTFALNSGTLPAGLSLSAAGVLSGTPTQTGSFPITVKATDSTGCVGIGPTYPLAISCQTITVTNPTTSTGTVDAAFSQSFTQTGAIGTTTFTLNSGTLPSGLTLAADGTLSGTPGEPGSFPITVKVTDANGCIGISATYTLTIACQTITVTNPTTSTGTVDAAFSQTFTQTGVGTHTPATFTLNSGTLPSGLTLAANGTLSGTPGAPGSFPITVKVTDANGCTGIGATYTLVIACQTITVTNPTTSTGTVDAAFSQTFTQTGVGTHTPATFTLNSGTLPSGLTLAANGTLSGTPGQSGSFPITVKVTDANGCTGIGSTYTLVIACQTITVTNPTTSTGSVDALFSQTFTQTGVGTHTPATFTLNSGTLPSGLTLAANGTLSGTPDVPGSFPITVKVTDANGCTGIGSTYTLVIACQTITVTNPITTTGSVDALFSQTFTQAGVGTHTPATFTLNSGTLPSGLTLAANGTLSGTPGQPGSFPITVKVTDSNGCTGIGSTYTLVIACQTINVTNPTTSTGTVDAAFSQTFTATGIGTHTPATFTLNSGTLPSGLTLAANGTLSGTPGAPGSFPITVTVTDANGCTGTGSTYNLVIGCQTITVTNPATTTGTVDAPFSETFTQTGAHGSTSFTTASTLPAGLVLSSAGVLSGTPTVAGTFPITVTVTDANGCTGTGSTYNLVIACQTITVTNPTTSTGTVDAAFSQTFTQSGVGTHTPATFTLNSGTLPSGLTLAANGTLSGTPGQAGSFPITVKVTDVNGCTGIGAIYTLVIACQTITVTNPTTSTGTVDAAFSQTFTQTGVGTHTPASFTINSGTLPSGLSLSTAGVLSGTPGQPGTFPITVKVTDANGCFGISATYNLIIGCQTIIVTNPATTTGTVGVAFSQQFIQTDAHGTATFTTASTLPTGFTLAADGTLSGTTNQHATFPIVVTVTDSNGCTGTSATYNLVINCQAITVTNPTTATGTLDVPFSQTFTQTGAVGTATFTLNSGTLPAGITLATNGTLSGTPGAPGSFPITVKVTDSNGCTGIGSTYTLVIACQTITVTNPVTSTGTVDTAFSQTFTQTGVGTHTPAVFTLNSGTLPSGLTLSSAGVLSGTPGQPGSFPITVKVTDSNGCTGTGSTYTLVIACQTITLTNPSTTTGTVDAAFSQTFTQAGVGTHTPAVFTIESGTLPPGLTLASGINGVLSGTPSQSGTFPITVKVTDANGCTGVGPTYNLVISCQTMTVTNPATTTGTVDAPFSQTFTQTGAHGTATFTTASTLPAGLSLSTAGVLSGTPTVQGTFPIVVTVTDSTGCTGTSATYNLIIGCQTIIVTNPATTTGPVGVAFSQQFTQAGAHGTASFTTASTLPNGLTLATNGTLSGTPTQTGSFPIVVTVTDSNGCTGTSSTYTLVINCQTITVTNPANTSGTVSAPFSETFTQTGAHGTATFTTASTLPNGLSLATNGTLSGTPTQKGSFPIVVTVTDSNGCTGTSSTYTLVIACQTITVTNPANSTGLKNTAFNETFTQSGGVGTITWSKTGTLPTGITLNSSNGVLSGTPTQSGSFPITVTATDGNGCIGVGPTYNLAINEAPTAANDPTGGIPSNSSPGSNPYHIAINTSIAAGSSPNLLANDTLGEPDATVEKFGPTTGNETPAGSVGASAAGGVLQVFANGSFNYTPPNATFTGLDSFRYKITNTAGSSTAIVSLAVGVRPAAANETYGATLIRNVGINTATSTNFSVLTNDMGDQRVAAFVSATNGNGTMAADGRFTFNPSTAAAGGSNGSITYSVSNGFGSVNGTVTIPLGNGRIWFVNQNEAVNGDGRLGTPFKNLSNFVSANPDAASDNIFLYSSATNYTGPITLEASEKLIGGGASATLATITGLTFPADSGTPPATGGTRPTIATGGITLATGNTIRGLNVANTTAAKIIGTAFGTVLIGDNTTPDVAVSGTGKALDLVNGTFAATSGFVSVASTSTAAGQHGLKLDTIHGTVSFGSTTINNSAIQGIFVTASDVDVNFGNTTIGTVGTANSGGGGGQEGLRLEANITGGAHTFTFGTLTISESAAQGITHGGTGGGGRTVVTGQTTINNPGATGILVNVAAASNGITFANVNVTGSAGVGVTLTNNVGAVTFADLDISPDSGQRGLLISNTVAGVPGTVTSTSGTISALLANAVEVDGFNNTTNRQPLALVFDSVSSTGGTNNVLLTNVSGSIDMNGGALSGSTAAAFNVSGSTATISYDGSITNSTGGISLTSNTGGTINFTGALSLSTGATTAFTATGGGTVNVTGATNTLTTTTGTALNVANTTIGASGLTFLSINSPTASANPGIVLNTTGAGAMTVTGTSTTAGTGGTISNKTGNGVDLRTASTVTLKNMNLTNNAQTNGEANPTLCGTTGLNGQNVNCTADVYLGTVSGITLDNVNINGSNQNGINGLNVVDLKIQNGSIVQNCGNESGESGVFIQNLTGLNNALTGSTFSGNRDWQFAVADFTSGALGNAGNPFNVSGCTFTGKGNATTSEDGFFALIRGTTTANINIGGGANTASHFKSNFSFGVFVTTADTASATLTVNGCDFGTGGSTTYNNSGIGTGISGASILNYTISNNTIIGVAVGTPGNGVGIIATTGTTTPGASIIGTISGNTIGDAAISGSGGFNNAAAMQLLANGGGPMIYKATVTGNHIHNPTALGIQYIGGTTTGAVTGTLHITGNDISTDNVPAGFPAGQAIAVAAAASGAGGAVSTLCADIGNGGANTITGTWDGANTDRIRVTTLRGSIYTVGGMPGSGAQTAAAVATFVGSQNGAAPPLTSSSNTASGGGTFNANSGAACPLLFAPGGILATPEMFAMFPFIGSNAAEFSATAAAKTASNIETGTLTPAPDNTLKHGFVAPPTSVSDSLSQQDLDLIVAPAIERWSATGLTPQQTATLHKLRFEVTALSSRRLGEASGNDIGVSSNAGGNGWFVDTSAQTDALFVKERSSTRSYTDPASAPAGRIDLLTAIMHEMGHALGLNDSYLEQDRDSLMYGYLTKGERRVPATGDAAGVKSAAQNKPQFLEVAPAVAPVSIGTIPQGKSVTVTFKVNINNPVPSGTTQISSQGTVSGGNFANVLTDDPDVGGTNDPTVTPLAVPPRIYSAQTPPATGTVSVPYGPYTFVADGNPAPTFAVQAGSLPPGLSLSAAGVLNGTPTASGTFSGIVVRATNTAGFFDTNPFTITITAPTPTPTPIPTATPSATATPGATPTPTPGGNPTPTPGVTPTPTPGGTPGPTPTPATHAINLSTRMRVQVGNNVGIGGFIVTGSVPKRVILRAIGPSLEHYGVPDVLADPVLELHGPSGFVTVINDNWRDTQEQEIQDTGIPPTVDLESAIVAVLNPGAYTAIVRGKNNTSGVALIEVYDLDQGVDSKLANLSTRAFVSTGDNIVIAGFLLSDELTNDRVIVRGVGPSLAPGTFPASEVLANPTLELRDANGALIRSNNDWQDNSSQAALITAAGLALTSSLESGIAETLPPGLYTALLAGLNNGTGIGLVEVYDLGAP